MSPSSGKLRQLIISKPHLVMKPRETERVSKPVAGVDSAEIYCPYCGKKRPAHVQGQAFDFHCPCCGHTNHAREDQVGTDIKCRSCGELITVPSPPEHPARTSKIAVEQQQTFKFFCLHCGQKLSAKHSMTGQVSLCPTCGRQLTVPAVEYY